MTTIKNLFRDTYYLTGLVFILASLAAFCYPLLFPFRKDEYTMLIIFHYGLAVFYFFYLLICRQNLEASRKYDYRSLLLVLLLISCYGLNREMGLFEESVNWWSALLVITSVNYLLFAVYDALPSWLRYISAAVSGLAFLMHTYLTIYLFPAMPLGILGMLALGIAIHLFVPVLFLANTIALLQRSAAKYRFAWQGFFTGFGSVLLFTLCYIICWARQTKLIYDAYHAKTNGLPAWIATAQRIPANYFTERILKTGLVYKVSHLNEAFSFFSFDIPDRNFEKKKHDPLISCAVALGGLPDIDEPTRIQLIKTLFKGGHHQSEQRFWSGETLYTNDVNTTIQIWEACNIAYTEKIIGIKNTEGNHYSQPQGEAIYTFYLPEGAVVTSLSLWVNGVEEKAIMTTKEKATGAYDAIVGRERRDPSVVHWREGNRVSVRVFPVTQNQPRQFKIGITTPLARENGKLVYENIHFDGPDESNASETTLVSFDQSGNDFELPASFVSKSAKTYSRSGNYIPHWELSIPESHLAQCSYSMEGFTYSLNPYHKKLEAATVNTIYADINSSWTKQELDLLLAKSSGKRVLVYTDKMEELTGKNLSSIYNQLHRNHFSLFPIYQIIDPAHSLVVTKGTDVSCDMDDLEGTIFMTATRKFLADGNTVRLFNLGGDLSPYLHSLKEYRVFQYDKGDMD
ncbi:MAG TPA: XrtN system VIT domain-containing protein, partial [Chitinophagaceae bacterium]|nr:XrtN system VIT domain-containing protein [Chitinophagaceae bacterium]